MFKRPIVGIAICMIVGIFVGYAAGIPLKFAYIGFFVFAIGSLAAWLWEKEIEKGITFIFICLSIFFLGMALIQVEREVLLNQSRALGVELNSESSNESKVGAHAEHGWRARRFQYLSIRGTIVNYPEERNVYRADAEEGEECPVPEEYRVENKISFPLRVEQVKRKDIWQDMDGKIFVNVYEADYKKRLLRRDASRNDKFRIGDRIEISGHLRPLPEMRNPGDFDYGAYLLRKGIVGQMSPVRDKTPKTSALPSAGISNGVSVKTKSEEGPVLGEPEPGSGRKGGGRRYGEVKNGMENGGCPYFSGVKILSRGNINFITRIAARGRDYMERIIDLGPYDNGREALLKAMLIGKREGLDEGMKQNFINTGTVHIMAISGLHLLIVMGIILFICKISFIPERCASLVCMVFLILYAFLTGGRVSVWRAAIMAALFLGGRFFIRQVDKWTTLSLAGLVILAISPQALFDSGFQLTFMAVGGLMYFYPRMENVLRERLKGLFNRSLSRYFLKAILAIMVAQLVLGPFLIYYYYRFPLITFIANLAIVPLLSIVTILGFVSSIAGLISLPLAMAFNATNSIFLLIMEKTTSFLGGLAGQIIYLPRPEPLFFLFYYTILFLLFYHVRKDAILQGEDKNK